MDGGGSKRVTCHCSDQCAVDPAGKPECNAFDAAVYSACVLALRDYVRKSGFERVTLGLSGGIDSALVAAMACDA
ncbi:MAG: hypothetical protein AAFO79_12570, partial [Pseudomonadota bacterium]